MKKITSNKLILFIIGLLLLFVIWEIISLIVNEPVLIFPNPIETIKYSFYLLGTQHFYVCLGYTFYRTIFGFIIALILALLLAIFVGNNKKLQKILEPTIKTLKSIPTAALVLLLLALLRAENTPIIIVTLISFPILYSSIITGINSISDKIEDSLKLDGYSQFKNNILVRLPITTPYIISGIVSSYGLSFKIAIMAEVITGLTSPGLGSEIKYLQTSGVSMVPIFAYSFNTILFILLLDLIFYFINKNIKKKLKTTI